jgi:hypothetical protein
MAWTDADGMENHGSLIAVSFWSTALLNAVLFRGPAGFARDLAIKARKHLEGWRGLIGHFKVLLIMSWHILEYDYEDDEILTEAHEAFGAFPLSQSARNVLTINPLNSIAICRRRLSGSAIRPVRSAKPKVVA